MRGISGRIHYSSVALLVAAAFWYSECHAQTLVHFDLPAQALARSLKAIGTASNTDVGFSANQVAGLTAPALKADLTVDDALMRVLVGSGLRPRRLDDHTIAIAAAEASTSLSRGKQSLAIAGSAPANVPDQLMAPEGPSQSDSTNMQSSSSQKKGDIEEIVVTGTHIHNAEPVVPLITITRDDILNHGYTTLDQVIEQLPQNFKAGASQDSNPISGAGNGASQNYGYASGVNLRGLGANATLVLLNGRRLAPTAYGGITDISQIPVSVIDRVEILTDGASAIYGSDAVAGVVNVITRRDYSGVELGGRIDSISEGKTPNYGGNVLGGTSWDGGNVVLDFDYEKDNPLLARNRSFTATLPDPTMLLPKNEKSSFYGSLQQRLADRLDLSGDALVTHRRYNVQDRLVPTDPFPYEAYGKSDQYTGSLELDYRMSSDWTATLVGQASKEADERTLVYTTGGFIDQSYPLDYQVFALEPRIDGKLFEMTGGPARVALGGQFRRETFKEVYESGSLTGPLAVTGTTNESRRALSAYGEILLPIVGGDNAMPFVRRLRIDISGRYDDYSDFGRTSNPKIAAEWVPLAGLALRATYSRSFQAPTLYETSNSFNFAYVTAGPDPKSPSGSSVLLLVDGTNPNLQAETARSFNAGVSYDPQFIEGLKFDAAYFSINFDNQINRLSVDGIFNNVLDSNVEPTLGSLVERDPSPSQIDQVLSAPGRTLYNGLAGYCTVGTSGCPAPVRTNIGALATIGYENAASVRVGGIDFTARYVGRTTPFGLLRADLDGTFFTTYQQQIGPGGTVSSPLNTLFNPLRFRAKANVGWEKAGWGGNARLNYSNAYQNVDTAINPNCPGGPGCGIASWTTLDLSLWYTSPASNSPLAGIRIGLNATNLFNRAPPTVVNAVGSGTHPYDPTNANAYLRMVGLTLTKRWGGASGR
ncbi:MAG: TonB-dependent receptor [Gammaproteobacteria bacterium]|nr:TonB-dependent receptor [Gammaproteobacteria bacterium]